MKRAVKSLSGVSAPNGGGSFCQISKWNNSERKDDIKGSSVKCEGTSSREVLGLWNGADVQCGFGWMSENISKTNYNIDSNNNAWLTITPSLQWCISRVNCVIRIILSNNTRKTQVKWTACTRGGRGTVQYHRLDKSCCVCWPFSPQMTTILSSGKEETTRSTVLKLANIYENLNAARPKCLSYLPKTTTNWRVPQVKADEFHRRQRNIQKLKYWIWNI